MKTAEVQKTRLTSAYPEPGEISASLDQLTDKLAIDTINWASYNYKPSVRVALSYSENEIFLKYYVRENYFKAEKTEDNDNVFEDSCVEFFVSPEDDGIYYNFEFNGLGTCLLGSGTGRSERIRATKEVTGKIRRHSSIGKQPLKERVGEFEWNLTVAIPFGVFFRHNVKILRGKTFRANFYKCGDKLTVPHYITWNPVDTLKPDYHQPVYFGSIKFN